MNIEEAIEALNTMTLNSQSEMEGADSYEFSFFDGESTILHILREDLKLWYGTKEKTGRTFLEFLSWYKGKQSGYKKALELLVLVED